MVCRPMGMGALGSRSTTFKKKNRWMMSVSLNVGDIDSPLGTFPVGIGDSGGEDSVSILPPQKSARPSVSFKISQAEHLSETISYPVKPEWKPINLVLYDIKLRKNPVFEWLKLIYNPDQEGNRSVTWVAQNVGSPENITGFKRNIALELYSGCGELIEKWKYINAYPESIDFGDLDMGSSDIIMVDLTLRYDRAFLTLP